MVAAAYITYTTHNVRDKAGTHHHPSLSNMVKNKTRKKLFGYLALEAFPHGKKSLVAWMVGQF